MWQISKAGTVLACASTWVCLGDEESECVFAILFVRELPLHGTETIVQYGPVEFAFDITAFDANKVRI